MDIKQIGELAGIPAGDIVLYGDNMAKLKNVKGNKNGKLILVTAMTSNKTGIGKTTVSIGLADALSKLGKNVMLALREPSMGPVFGIKGGATGGGKSRVEPSDEINLHFTGDFAAIAQANNLLASIIDNHIYFGNKLNIDTKNIFFKRCLDLNDRSLRRITYKIGDEEIETGFNITAASEVMAVLCLSEDIKTLKENLGNILVALNKNGEPVYAKDLGAEEAMTILLKDALNPNLVKTIENTPAIVHLGPFANIAHGCNSVSATNYALTHADYTVTEAGFGSDLGAEKFLDIKTRIINKTPECAVLVIVLNVIKEHGNGDIVAGFENVKRHIHNLRDQFGLNLVVAINKHGDDDPQEIALVEELLKKENAEYAISEGFAKGGEGCVNLANLVLNKINNTKEFHYTYDMKDTIKDKINKIATKIYGATSVAYSEVAERKIKLAEKFGYGGFFVNVAKTQFSFTDNKDMLGAPTDFVFNITDVEIRSGAKMIVPIAGAMLLMPGLGKSSNYLNMQITNDGEILGLF